MIFLKIILFNLIFFKDLKPYDSLEDQWEDFDRKHGITKEDLDFI